MEEVYFYSEHKQSQTLSSWRLKKYLKKRVKKMGWIRFTLGWQTCNGTILIVTAGFSGLWWMKEKAMWIARP